MALKHRWIVFVWAMFAWNCGESAAPAPEPEEPEALSVTRWSEATELFAEYPPLVAGEPSRFAIHLTRLDSFAPVTEGHVEVSLSGGAGPPEVFRVDAPSRPGIFGVDVQPARPGHRELVISLRAPDLEDEHRVGKVEIFPHPDAAWAALPADAADDTAGISFLKEQQWSLEFATAVVREQSLRESVRVPARIEPRPGGAADVVAPTGGRLTGVLDIAPGNRVARGQELARVLPPPTVAGERPELQRALTDARAGLELAIRDRERAERLTTAGAAPQKRLDEARTAEAQAQARVTAADASLRQHDAARGGGDTPEDSHFVLRAPVAGIIAYRAATNGANVGAGALLFRVVDADQVHVVGQVPEGGASRTLMTSGAEMEIPGRPERVPAGRLVAIGQVLDPQSRSLPVTFRFDNRTYGLPIGHAVFLHLLMGATPVGPVVPPAAVIDDAGRPIVFVQREGETFERRPVTLGARTGDLVQILDGVTPGERVVVKGAYLVRLASLSTSAPAHGHVH